jgi:uncharacterized protein
VNQLPDTPKRFVAGAKCPQCQALDKVVMFRKEGIQYQSCVSCGYMDDMVFERQFRELDTRVNRTADERRAELAVIRIVDRAPDKSN